MNYRLKFSSKLLIILCKVVGLLPTWFLYHMLLDVLYFILYRVVRYRVDVVRENLRNSFPDYSEQRLKEIEWKFYRHLAEIFIDTIDMASISQKELSKRIRFTNQAEIETQTAGKDWIAALAHYGSWEYFGEYQTRSDHQVVGVYKPLHSAVFEEYYKEVRARFNLEPVAMNRLLRHIIKNKKNGGRNIAIGLIADQTPPWFEIDHWYDFMNQPTPFYMGMATLAQKFKMPIYYLHIKKLNINRYEGWFEQIYDGYEEVDPHQIIERYAKKLEAQIMETPEIWIWSHKRWKFKP